MIWVWILYGLESKPPPESKPPSKVSPPLQCISNGQVFRRNSLFESKPPGLLSRLYSSFIGPLRHPRRVKISGPGKKADQKKISGADFIVFYGKRTFLEFSSMEFRLIFFWSLFFLVHFFLFDPPWMP